MALFMLVIVKLSTTTVARQLATIRKRNGRFPLIWAMMPGTASRTMMMAASAASIVSMVVIDMMPRNTRPAKTNGEACGQQISPMPIHTSHPMSMVPSVNSICRNP